MHQKYLRRFIRTFAVECHGHIRFDLQGCKKNEAKIGEKCADVASTLVATPCSQ